MTFRSGELKESGNEDSIKDQNFFLKREITFTKL
jgi:hypothetical protein